MIKMTPGPTYLASHYEEGGGLSGSRGLPCDDHLSLFQSGPSRVFAPSSSRKKFSRRSSTGGMFPFIADLHARSSGCLHHASVSTAAETVVTERCSNPPPSQENPACSNHHNGQSPRSPIKFDTHRALRRSSMPSSNVAFFDSAHSVGNCMPNDMTLYHDLDGKLERATGPMVFAADARCAENKPPQPPSGESWTQQIKKLRENTIWKDNSDMANNKKSCSLFDRAEVSLSSLQYSGMLQQKNQRETPPNNLLVQDQQDFCLTKLVNSKPKLKIGANDLPSPALGVVSTLIDNGKSPKAGSSSLNVTTVLAHNAEPREEKVHNPIALMIQDSTPGFNQPADRPEDDSSTEQRSEIDDGPAEYARHLMGLPARSKQQQQAQSRKGEEELYEQSREARRQRPVDKTPSAHQQQHQAIPGNVEGAEEESWTSYHGLDGEMSDVTVTSFESYELEFIGTAPQPSIKDGASLRCRRCREEIEQLIGQILLEEEETLQCSVLSLEQVRALHSLQTENMEAILRYMEICRYANMATRWDLVSDMIGNVEQEAEKDRIIVDDEEQSVASSDVGFIGRSSCEVDMCSIGSGGLSLEADTVACDSSISISDCDDVTFYSEYEEEEVVEEEVEVAEVEEELDETTVVSVSEHFRKPCQLYYY
jgi:hypothetical protein